MTSQLNELLFLYSNINGKDEFIKSYNIHLSRRLLFNSAWHLDTERNIISRIRSRWFHSSVIIVSTGVLSASTMESILSDMNTNMSESCATESTHA